MSVAKVVDVSSAPVLGPLLRDRVALDGDIPNVYQTSIFGFVGVDPGEINDQFVQNLFFDDGVYNTYHEVPFRNSYTLARRGKVCLRNSELMIAPGSDMVAQTFREIRVVLYVGTEGVIDYYLDTWIIAGFTLREYANKFKVRDFQDVWIDAGKSVFLRVLVTYESSTSQTRLPRHLIWFTSTLTYDDNQYVV